MGEEGYRRNKMPAGLSMADPAYYKELKRRAQENRNHLTDSEQLMWNWLTSPEFSGFKFRRQHIIDKYIVDFVCLSKKLVIEIDGGYHFQNDQIEDDKIRTLDLNSLGFKVIRFRNEEVNANLSSVLTSIKSMLNS